MATATQNDFSVTNTYQNIVSTIGALASTAAFIQNVGSTTVSVVAQASGSAPTTKTGYVLQPGQGMDVTAAQVWVKCFGGATGTVSVTLT